MVPIQVARYTAVLAIAAALSCGRQEGNPAPSLADVLVTELRVLTSDSLLHDIIDMGIDDAGRVWALSGFEPFVHVLTEQTGTHLRVGRRGEGPEEFRLPWYLVDRDGVNGMSVWDVGNRKLVTLDPEGRIVSELRLQQSPGVVLGNYRATQFGEPLEIRDLNGTLVLQAFTRPLRQSGDLWNGVLVRLDPYGALSDTIIRFNDLPRPSAAAQHSLFAPGPLWSTCQRRTIVVLNPHSALLSWYDPHGRLLEEWNLDLPIIPVRRVDVERHVYHQVDLELREEGSFGKRSPEIVRFVRSIVPRLTASVPSSAPPVGIRCDEAGRVWVQLFSTEHDPRGGGSYWLATDGVANRVVRFPDTFVPLRIRRTSAVGFVVDHLGVQLPVIVTFSDPWPDV